MRTRALVFGFALLVGACTSGKEAAESPSTFADSTSASTTSQPTEPTAPPEEPVGVAPAVHNHGPLVFVGDAEAAARFKDEQWIRSVVEPGQTYPFSDSVTSLVWFARPVDGGVEVLVHDEVGGSEPRSAVLGPDQVPFLVVDIVAVDDGVLLLSGAAPAQVATVGAESLEVDSIADLPGVDGHLTTGYTTFGHGMWLGTSFGELVDLNPSSAEVEASVSVADDAAIVDISVWDGRLAVVTSSGEVLSVDPETRAIEPVAMPGRVVAADAGRRGWSLAAATDTGDLAIVETPGDEPTVYPGVAGAGVVDLAVSQLGIGRALVVLAMPDGIRLIDTADL